MAEGQAKLYCDYVSPVLVEIANLHRTVSIALGGSAKDIPVFKISDFNPYATSEKQSVSPEPVRKVTMAELKGMMPDLAKPGSKRRMKTDDKGVSNE